MSFLDRFKNKKKDLPAGAKPATRKRRSSAGGGIDEGYLIDGQYVSLSGGSSSDADYSEPARSYDDSVSRSSTSSYGGGATYGGSDHGSACSGGGTSSYDSGSGSSGSSSSSSSDSSGGGSCGSSD